MSFNENGPQGVATSPARDDAAPRAAARPFAAETAEAYEIVAGAVDATLVILADHATNRLPEGYPPALGMDPAEFERHIAYDIGVEGVVRRLAAMLDAPAVLSRFSRLLIDPNRGEDDPTLVMRLSDRAIIPANHRVDEAERTRRIETYWRPYDRAVNRVVEETALATGRTPLIVSIHSFTPYWREIPRPWQVGVLWDGDDRVARPLIDMLAEDGTLTVGDNEPYDGALGGDMMNRQCHARGIPHALLEVRQDLIRTEEGQREWAERLAPVLERIDALPDIHETRHFRSRAR